MSTCISRHGEYGEHIPDADYTCTRCAALDEVALIAERNLLAAQRDAVLKLCANGKVTGRLIHHEQIEQLLTSTEETPA